MINMIRTFTIILILISAAARAAFAGGAGTYAASFLKVTPGARAAAMSGAFCAVSDDVSAIQFNPAGLVQIRGSRLMFSHNEWIEGVKNEYIGFAGPRVRGWTVGAGVRYLFVKGLVRRDSSGAETGGTFGSDNTAVDMAAAKEIGKGLSAGVNLKIVTERVDDKKDTAAAADIAILKRTKDCGFGVSLQNVGTPIRLNEESFSLPLDLTAGVSRKVLKKGVVAVDVSGLLEGSTDIKAGGEYEVSEALLLRAGYSSARDENTGPGITAGIGLKLGEFGFDYGFSGLGDLGNIHRISLGMSL